MEVQNQKKISISFLRSGHLGRILWDKSELKEISPEYSVEGLMLKLKL